MRICLIIAASLAPLAAADATPPLPPAREAFIRSLASAPAIQAANERIVAARRSAAAAGRLPDPQLAAGYARKSTAMDSWPMYDLTLEQPLPRWGERDARRAKASAETALSEAELQEVLGETAAEIASLLAEADAARARLALVEGRIARATSLQSAIAARVAAGTAGSAERLGVTSRLAALAVERDTIRRQLVDAEQEVRSRLGLAQAAPLPAFAAPDRATVVIDRVPGMLAARARTADADSMYREARASRYPETAVGLRYEREQVPGDPMDTVGLEFRVSLPVWQGAAADLEDAASARRRAARHEADGWQYRVQTLLGRAERASAVAATARAAAQDTKARLDAEYDAVVSSTATQGGASLGSALDVLDRLSEAEAMVIEAEAAARLADAGLWRLAPPDLATIATPRSAP